VEERRLTWMAQALADGVDSPVLLLLQQIVEMLQQQQNLQATQLHFLELQEGHCRNQQKLEAMQNQGLQRISELVGRSMASEIGGTGGGPKTPGAVGVPKTPGAVGVPKTPRGAGGEGQDSGRCGKCCGCQYKALNPKSRVMRISPPGVIPNQGERSKASLDKAWSKERTLREQTEEEEPKKRRRKDPKKRLGDDVPDPGHRPLKEPREPPDSPPGGACNFLLSQLG